LKKMLIGLDLLQGMLIITVITFTLGININMYSWYLIFVVDFLKNSLHLAAILVIHSEMIVRSTFNSHPPNIVMCINYCERS